METGAQRVQLKPFIFGCGEYTVRTQRWTSENCGKHAALEICTRSHTYVLDETTTTYKFLRSALLLCMIDLTCFKEIIQFGLTCTTVYQQTHTFTATWETKRNNVQRTKEALHTWPIHHTNTKAAASLSSARRTPRCHQTSPSPQILLP